MNNSKHLKKTLLNMIEVLSTEHREFLMNPISDFTRNRKLSFIDTVKFIICMEAGSIKDELYKYFGLHVDNPTSSAFIQQRGKIKAEAFQWLFDTFNKKTREHKHYKGYRLLAIDGSTVPIRYDKNDKETYLDYGDDKKGYNAFHLNATYDLLEHTYDDVMIQGKPYMNENGAFYDLVDRYKGNKAIFIGDRYYEAYNSFEHVVHSNNYYLIRVKDSTSNGIASRCSEVGNEDFDIDYEKILTLKQTNEVKNNPQLYTFLPSSTRFDYLTKENPYYNFKCRVVRFKITEDTYETIITNLDREEFTVEQIKELYHMRWGIEISFRELKYAVNLNVFHAKKNEFIKQEIYARLLFYNFSERIIRKVKPKSSKKARKHIYQINFTRAFHNIRAFLKYKKGGKYPPDIQSIIAKELEPIRLDRSEPRNIRAKSCVHFVYRLN